MHACMRTRETGKFLSYLATNSATLVLTNSGTAAIHTLRMHAWDCACLCARSHVRIFRCMQICVYACTCVHVCTRDQCSLYHPPPPARSLLPPPSRTHCLSLTHSVCLYPPAAVCADARTLTLLTPVPLLSVLANSRAHCILIIVSGMCVCVHVCVCVRAHTHTRTRSCACLCVCQRALQSPHRTLARSSVHGMYVKAFRGRWHETHFHSPCSGCGGACARRSRAHRNLDTGS